MSDLEVRQLRYFVAVAEELHFGRAAERLGMAQPPLSRAIRDLERHLGVGLLERTTRQVRLTPAGEVLLRDARTALDAVSAAERRARHAGQPVRTLRLALKADHDAGMLPRMLAAYEREEAALPVELQLGGRGEQVAALRDGRADVALLPTPFDDRGLDVEPLLTEPRLVALPAADPLAARTELRPADLAGRLLPDGTAADGSDAPPAWPPRSLDLAQIFNLVEVGSIVWFLPESLARRHPRPEIAYRPVADLAPSTLVVAWPRESRSPAVAAFVRVARSVFADAGLSSPASPASGRS
ncbi:LysR family transcriptional regulator [Nucisporomicrobium flavum]|uniref:LysR family transcriptional regulator n=1 Tax=Nucisporomicrobium flavum TaxID=2785915 RepID=UPI0018F4A385|nr:LysR substrate-binding domain-containing protein [Nucisporomicrobium flavum]